MPDRIRHDPLEAGQIEKKTGLVRLWRALFYSLEGLGAAYRHEAAFRQEVWLAVLLIPVALWSPAGVVGQALMVGSVLIVLIVELLNSAVEAVVDLASPERHPLAKRAKDVASAAVLLALINLAVIWLLVLS